MIGTDINDPVMQEFKDNLDIINALAEKSEGFVWRFKEDSRDASRLNPYLDNHILINFSVWENVEALENFMYNTMHSYFLKHRKKWFQSLGKSATALWWVPNSYIPTIEEAVEKLDYLHKNGPSAKVFDFKHKFPSH